MNLNFNATNAELYAYYHCKQKRPLKIHVQKKIDTLPSSISSLYHSTSNLIENVPRQHHYRKSHKTKCTQVDAEYLCPFSSNDHRMRDGNSICDDQGHIHRYTEGRH
ncbi:hypothetical protein GJ496_008091 [Pomphorhynchus laevis]|nr:hypothetical protein GJ496_008091 [Pomphorhynchus laevis]